MDAHSEQARVMAALVNCTTAEIAVTAHHGKERSYLPLANGCRFIQTLDEQGRRILFLIHQGRCTIPKPHLRITATGEVGLHCELYQWEPQPLAALIDRLREALNRGIQRPKYIEYLYACCTDARLRLLAQQQEMATV